MSSVIVNPTERLTAPEFCADQHAALQVAGHLRQCQAGHLDVIGDRVRSRVPWRSTMASGSPKPSCPWSANTVRGRASPATVQRSRAGVSQGSVGVVELGHELAVGGPGGGEFFASFAGDARTR